MKVLFWENAYPCIDYPAFKFSKSVTVFFQSYELYILWKLEIYWLKDADAIGLRFYEFLVVWGNTCVTLTISIF